MTGRRRRSPGKDIPVTFALLACWAALAMPLVNAVTKNPQTPGDSIRLRHFDDDDDDSDEGPHEPHFHSDEEMGGHAERDAVPEVWVTGGTVDNPRLLEVQALIVKDEQVTDDCRPSTTDLRKSNWRHLMCYGSIVSNTFVLTSSSCIHEALYIRHNIHAPLAAVIAPLAESIQVIKISQYIIHPKIDVDPRHTEDHIKHDLAVARLSCKILKINFFPIELPTKPLSEMCEGGKCFVTVIKRKEDHTNLIFQYIARDIESHKISTRQLSPEDKGNDSIKEAMKRRMCTKSGSAVMADKIQAGLVAMSCDVRQPETHWLYTDLYDSIEWIIGIADLTRPKSFGDDNNAEVQYGKKSPEKCSTCVYNFYFNWKEEEQKEMCPNKLINNVADSLTPCKSNSANSGNKEKSSNFISAYPKDDYLRALDTMYRDQFKHNHQGVQISPPKFIDTISINDQMIPVSDNFEVSPKANTNKNIENQNVDASKISENENQKSSKTSNGIDKVKQTSNGVDKVSARNYPDVPEEYKNLYDQYLQELQLKKS